MAIAEAGREGEVRYFGEVDASDTSMRRVIQRIAAKFDRIHLCYEAGSHVRPYAATLTATHGCATRSAPAIACCPIRPQTRNSQPRTLASAGAEAGHSILSESD